MRTDLILAVSDLLAIALIVAIYFHHHQRRDLVLAYVALNVGILAVTATLSSASVGAGLGLGLFGILSIIRLRSDSITQEEIAYYFVALALGLLAGLHPGRLYVTPILCALLVLVMLLADSPRLLPRCRRALLTLDSAIPDEVELRSHIEDRLGVEVRHLIVQEINFVQDLTIVDVRYRIPAEGDRRVGESAAAGQPEREPVSHRAALVTSNGVPGPGLRAASGSNEVRTETVG